MKSLFKLLSTSSVIAKVKRFLIPKEMYCNAQNIQHLRINWYGNRIEVDKGNV